MPSLKSKICDAFGTPKIDVFASRLNAKLDSYFSWKPDPDAVAIDAFAQVWSKLVFYAFPPLNLIGKVLAKLHKVQASGVVVVPFWSTQPWFPQAIGMLTKTPLLFFPPSYRLLTLPGLSENTLCTRSCTCWPCIYQAGIPKHKDSRCKRYFDLPYRFI